jgi:mannose-6-phosphate isomerase-like protein (cupin superfamily)
MPAIHRPADQLEVFKIAATDTNKFALIADPVRDQVPFFACVEIFEPGGATPPNTHADAHEMFFVLSGTGTARAGDVERAIGPGDSVVVKPGHEHVIANTGPDRLYTLTVMIPNEGFAELIRSGLKASLDGRDLAALTGAALTETASTTPSA